MSFSRAERVEEKKRRRTRRSRRHCARTRWRENSRKISKYFRSCVEFERVILGSLVIPRHFFAFFGETRARRVSNRYPRDDALSKPPGHHPSSRKSVRIGESSSIKGPISDDKDLGWMNGPRHSNGSLSSRRSNHSPPSPFSPNNPVPPIINYIRVDSRGRMLQQLSLDESHQSNSLFSSNSFRLWNIRTREQLISEGIVVQKKKKKRNSGGEFSNDETRDIGRFSS